MNKTEQFNLSEKLINQEFEKWEKGYPIYHTAILIEDVKEFIRLLKEFEWTSIFVKERQQNMIEAFKLQEFFDRLDKLAGDKLI